MVKPVKKTNPILKLGIFTILFVAALLTFVLVKTNGGSAVQSARAEGEVVPSSVDADSPVETIKSLKGVTQKVLEENERLTQENKAALAEMESMEAKRLEEIERLKNELEVSSRETQDSHKESKELFFSQFEEINKTFKEELALLKAQLDERDVAEDTLSLRSDEIEAKPTYTSGQRIPAKNTVDIVYVTSLDEVASGGMNTGASDGRLSSLSNVTEGLETGRLLTEKKPDSNRNGEQRPLGYDPNVASSIARFSQPEPGIKIEEEEPTTVPYFTVPDLSVLSNGSALTALMGNVYRDGKVVNPAPIKVIVGKNNLTANFKELPAEIEGIIFGGYAVGDPTFACVRGKLTAATFVFTDGTVKSAYIGDEGARPENDAYPSDTIGYISDPWGNPCIPGTYTTDAVKQLGSLALLDGLAGYTRALRQQEVETSVFGSDNGPVAVENLTGDPGRFAVATGVADGLDNASEWAKGVFEKIFEGYYVRAGINVSIHVEQELRLDKEPNARLIRYKQSRVSNQGLD